MPTIAQGIIKAQQEYAIEVARLTFSFIHRAAKRGDNNQVMSYLDELNLVTGAATQLLEIGVLLIVRAQLLHNYRGNGEG